MAKEGKNEKIITLILAIVISLAAITIIYVSLPNDSDTNTADQEDITNGENSSVEENILTLIYGEEELEYTLSDLEEMEAYSGSGKQIKAGALPEEVIIKGPYNFIGVRFTTLFGEIDNLPSNYNVTVTATDDWVNHFTKDNITGNVWIYNESGVSINNTGATMLLAYKEDSEYISVEDGGPLRIGFLGDEIITESDLWAKKVATIEIIEV